MTEVDDDKKRWIYDDEPEKLVVMKEKEKAAKEKAAAEASNGPITFSSNPPPSLASIPEQQMAPIQQLVQQPIPQPVQQMNPFFQPTLPPIQTIAPKPSTPKVTVPKKPGRKPKKAPSPQKRKKSTRERKPTKRMGLDGADDESEDSDDVIEQHASESQMSLYDQFQGLTSPGSQVALGKRKRKSLIPNFKDLGDDDSDAADDYEGDSGYD